jgi:hypothetical protein
LRSRLQRPFIVHKDYTSYQVMATLSCNPCPMPTGSNSSLSFSTGDAALTWTVKSPINAQVKQRSPHKSQGLSGRPSTSELMSCSVRHFPSASVASSRRKPRLSLCAHKHPSLIGPSFSGGLVGLRGPVLRAPVNYKRRVVAAMALTGPLVDAKAGVALWAVLAAAAAAGQVRLSASRWDFDSVCFLKILFNSLLLCSLRI